MKSLITCLTHLTILFSKHLLTIQQMAHTNDLTLYSTYGIHHDRHWILLKILFTHHWIPPQALRIVDWAAFLPQPTSSITAPHTTETLPFSQLHTCLYTPSHRDELYSQDTQYTIYCMAFSLCSMFLHTRLDASFTACSVPFPSLHELTIPHHWLPPSRKTLWTHSRIGYHGYHSLMEDAPTAHHTAHSVCMQSSTSFQYSRYLILQDWLITHSDQDWPGTWTQQVLIVAHHSNTVGAQDWPGFQTQPVHRTRQVNEHTRCKGLPMY